MERWRNLDFDAVREANRKQAIMPEGSFVIDPAGTAPGLVVPPADGRDGPDGRGAARAAARAARDVAGGRRERRVRGGDGRAHRLRAAHAAPVRHPRVGDRGDAARGRARWSRGSSSSRSPPACAAASSRWWSATSRHAAAPTTRSRRVIAERHGQYLFSTDGSTIDDQVAELLGDMQIAVGESCTGGPDGGAADGSGPGSSGYVAGRRRGLLERGEGRSCSASTRR